VIGQRVFPDKYGTLRLAEGAFGLDLRGVWWCRPPGESLRRNLDRRVVIEHADGTLTVRGTLNGGLACFALERGVWTNLNGG